MNLQGFFHSARFKVLLCVAALLLGVLLYSLRQGARMDRVSAVLDTITQPVRRAASAISGSVNEKLDTYYGAKAYREENARLREAVAKLQEELIGYDAAVEERDALRGQLQIKEEHDDFVLSEPCKVMMPVTNDLTGSFRLDKGEADGIPLNAPVLCPEGLVGVVTELSKYSATVTTILSPELSVGAVCLQSSDSGIVEGTLKYAAAGATKMIYLNEDHGVKKGDLVCTAGTTGIFPYGIPIGTVLETGMEETGLTAYAVIAPGAALEDLESVTVLLDFEGKDETEDEPS